jgi:glucose/arabinose dehydrogenase
MKAIRPVSLVLTLLSVLAAGCVQARPLPGSGAVAPAATRIDLATAMSPQTGATAPGPAEATGVTAEPTRPPSRLEVSTSPPAIPTKPRPTTLPVTPSPASTASPEAFSIDHVNVSLLPVASGLDRPLFVTHAGDGSGRLFIVEKAGTIRVFAGERLIPRPFLDIRDRVLSRGSEQGLLGLAFDPDFRRSGAFFVNYTDRSGNTVISRFRVTADANLADPASELKVLGIDQPAANHNGGMLAFGPDGYLYVGTGDGGGAGDRFGNGQNPQSLLGKMLRIDVRTDPSAPYVVPPSNPWVTATRNGQSVRPEIWALGLRNPWRFSFDRQKGDLWIADVGQDQYEEIDRVPAGAGGNVQGGINFGWRIMEGTHCFPDSAKCGRDGLVLPVAEYAHGADGCSITGGYLYRGAAIPGLAGAYLYGDYCSGRIWALTPAAGGGWDSRLLLESGLTISSFGEDQAGELYVADLQGGRVYRLVSG